MPCCRKNNPWAGSTCNSANLNILQVLVKAWHFCIFAFYWNSPVCLHIIARYCLPSRFPSRFVAIFTDLRRNHLFNPPPPPTAAQSVLYFLALWRLKSIFMHFSWFSVFIIYVYSSSTLTDLSGNARIYISPAIYAIMLKEFHKLLLNIFFVYNFIKEYRKKLFLQNNII